jgi:hypothetical protein
LVREWVKEKRVNPILTAEDFFKRHSIHPAVGSRAIAKQMKSAWAEAQQKSVERVIEKTGIDLADEMEKQFRAAKTAFAVGARMILPRIGEDGTEIPAPQQPATYAEALMLMRTGSEAMRDLAKIMTGGEALRPPEDIETVINWVAPKPAVAKKQLEGPKGTAEEPATGDSAGKEDKTE